MNPAVQYKNICIKYPQESTPVFTNFNLDILPGEKVVLSGPSGSGKSTLLNALMGFVQPEKGKIAVFGKTVGPTTITMIRKELSWVPQHVAFDIKSCKALVYFPFQFEYNKMYTPRENEVNELAEKLALPTNILTKETAEVSGGQLQRLVLVSVLLLKRKILILDEPTSGLDDDSTKAILAYLKSAPKLTVISTSHDSHWKRNMDKVIEICKK